MITVTDKRYLIINDDDREEEFYIKYKNLIKYKNYIYYCNNADIAFEKISSRNFSGFDKIILDIKIDWGIPEKYESELNNYLMLDKMEEEGINKGFIIFMYLVARGFPIHRIAFLSAYIREEDDTLEVKKKILNKMAKWKKRCPEYDKELVDCIEELPDDLQTTIKRNLEFEEHKKGVWAYTNIKEILEQEIESVEGVKYSQSNDEFVGGIIESNEGFFRRIDGTGLRVKNKINKKNADLLQKMIEEEACEELRRFYQLRYEILNVCEEIKKNRLQLKLNKCYTEIYFQELFQAIQEEITIFGERNSCKEVCFNVVKRLVAFMETMKSGEIKDKTDVSSYAMKMLLKNTRNWMAHERIKGFNSQISIQFCEIVFLVTIRLLYGENQDIADFIQEVHNYNRQKNPETKDLCRRTWRDINQQVGNTKDAYTYIIDLDTLYYNFSHMRNRNNITLKLIDLVKLFILCLHYPSLASADGDCYKISFHDADENDREDYMVYLEKMAFEMIEKEESICD